MEHWLAPVSGTCSLQASPRASPVGRWVCSDNTAAAAAAHACNSVLSDHASWDTLTAQPRLRATSEQGAAPTGSVVTTDIHSV